MSNPVDSLVPEDWKKIGRKDWQRVIRNLREIEQKMEKVKELINTMFPEEK